MIKPFKIPLIDLKKEYRLIKKDINFHLKSCFKTHDWILGSKVRELERKLATYLGVKYTLGVASGTDALLLSLRALAIKLKKRDFFSWEDEIITTPLTFIATGEAILRSGAKPVFVDIEEDTLNIDSREIKKAITRKTAGIIAVHLYGSPCEMEAIVNIAKEYNLFIVEDCAQSFGSEYKEKKTGSWGDCGCFSFFPSKNLGAYGDAGLISTSDERLAELLYILRNHGQSSKNKAVYTGYNSRLDNLQAAVILAKLKYLKKWQEMKNRIFKEYNKQLKNLKEITLPSPTLPLRKIFWHLYTLKSSLYRNKLLKFLNSQGIEARIYYPFLLPQLKPFKRAKIFPLNKAYKILSQIISLPFHPFLTHQEISLISKKIHNFFRQIKR